MLKGDLMAIIKEVLDALTAVKESIDHIQTISDAIKKGKDYLITQHPNVANDLVIMCEEMRKSSQALASASSIITHFRFVIGDTQSTEASRFNEHLVSHKLQAETVDQQLNSMRGHCHIIEQHVNIIRDNADPKGLRAIAAVLGLHSGEKENQLADAIEGIYNEELQYMLGVNAMAHAIKTTLHEVQNELGPAGMIDPKRIPLAAAVLGEYAQAFEQLQARCNHNALELQTSINQLQT